MKATSDDFQPRRDGWYEHDGTWGEVTVGTVLASSKRSERWEVIDTAMGPDPIRYGWTLWFQIREQTTGEVHPVRPRPKTSRATILTQDPRDTKTPDPTGPSDAEAIMLLVRELGAEELATRDLETGEITCPDYLYDSHVEGTGIGGKDVRRGLIEHMRFAHKMSVDDDLDIAAAITVHGQGHDPRWPNIGKGGFAHRHVPEDMTLLTGGKSV